MALKLRRGTDLERQSVIFEEGELIYTTDTKTLWVGDGQTLGGIKVSGPVAESPIALSSNLDLNGFDIVGGGDINITGTVVSSAFFGDGSGLSNLPLIDVAAGGTYNINIVGNDSSIIVDSATNTITGVFAGSDGTTLLNPLTNTFSGNIVTNTIDPVSDRIIMATTVPNQSLILKLESNETNANLDFIRNSDTDIGDTALTYGILRFGRNDVNGLKYTSTILASHDQLIFTTNKNSVFDEASSFTWGSSAKFGIGTLDPLAKLDVRGDVRATGSFTVGSYTDLDRPTGVNGMIIYNTTVNKLQGFQNDVWINLDGS